MGRPLKFSISDVAEKDFPEIQKIYSYYVLNTTISLEEIPPSVDEMILRWKKSIDYIVAKIDSKIVGYAYAFLYRPRSAYRFTIEESVYVAQDAHGLGIGKALLEELVKRSRAKGYKQMLAVIAGADNAASINFHEKLGFKKSGVLENFGFKFDKWVDTALMQLGL